MSTSGKIRKIARERNISEEMLIPETIKKQGSIIGAARELDLAPNSVSKWLRLRGLKVMTRQVAEVVRIDQTIKEV